MTAVSLLAPLLIAAAVTALSTPLVARFARIIGAVDKPDARKVNRRDGIPLLGGMAVALMYLGGLKPLQTASLIVALPLVFVIALCVWSFLRWLREDGAGR